MTLLLTALYKFIHMFCSYMKYQQCFIAFQTIKWDKRKIEMGCCPLLVL